MSDFVIGKYDILKKYSGNDKHVTIPDGVKQIGENAFRGNTCLESVIVPKGVGSIADNAFRDCCNLQSINIPDGVVTICEGAFSGCSSLMDLVIPDSVTTIGFGCFSGCVNLQNVNIPAGITHLPERIFSGCSSLRNISIPNTVKRIGSHAFCDCAAEITLPKFFRINQSMPAHACSFLYGANLCARDMVDLMLHQPYDEWNSIFNSVHSNPEDTLNELLILEREPLLSNRFVLLYLLKYGAELGSRALPVFEFFLHSGAKHDFFILAKAKDFFENGDTRLQEVLKRYVISPSVDILVQVAMAAIPPFPTEMITKGEDLCSLAVSDKIIASIQYISQLLFNKKSTSKITLKGTKVKVPANVIQWLLIELARCRSVQADVKRVIALLNQEALTTFLWNLYTVVPNRPVQTDISMVIWMIGHIGTEAQVSRMLSDLKEIRRRTEVSATGSGRGRNAYAIQQSVAYNDSPEVLLMLDKRGELAASAKVRGMSVEALRAQLQAATDNMLDSQGTYRLNYGDNQFSAILKPDMTLAFRNEKNGKISKSLPKPGKTDDPVLAAAAAEDVKKLKTNIKNLSGQRTKGIQEMLYSGSSMPYADWKAQYLSSVILKTLAGGILWGVFDGKDTLLQPFCLNADGRPADASGNEVLPQDSDHISVVDASQLSPEALEAWRALFWGKGTKAVVRQFELPGRYVTKELATKRYEKLTVSVGYAFNALEMGSVDSSQFASIDCNYIDVALHARWGDEVMEISDISFAQNIPAFDQMTDHQKRLWNRDIIRLDSILHPEKQVEEIVCAGDVTQIKSFVDTHLITADNITDMLGLAIKHKRTETTAFLMQLKHEWLGDVQDPFAEFKLDF